MLESFTEKLTGADWDVEQKCIRNQNVPFGENRVATNSVQQLLSQYESYNPDWRQGSSLPIMMKLDWETLQSVFKNNLRRMRR